MITATNCQKIFLLIFRTLADSFQQINFVIFFLWYLNVCVCMLNVWLGHKVDGGGNWLSDLQAWLWSVHALP